MTTRDSTAAPAARKHRTCINQDVVDFLTEWLCNGNFNDRMSSTITRAISQIRKEKTRISSKADALRIKYVGEVIGCQVEMALRKITVTTSATPNSGPGFQTEKNCSLPVLDSSRQSAHRREKKKSKRTDEAGDLKERAKKQRCCKFGTCIVVDKGVFAGCHGKTRRPVNFDEHDLHTPSEGASVDKTSASCHCSNEEDVEKVERSGSTSNNMVAEDFTRRTRMHVAQTQPHETSRTETQSSKEYEPRFRSGPFALLIALYEAFLGNILALGKHDLIKAAIPYADEPFMSAAGSTSFKSAAVRYDGWSSMGSTLIKKGLVSKYSNPAKYSLTLPGMELARRLSEWHRATFDHSIRTPRTSQGRKEEGTNSAPAVNCANDNPKIGLGTALHCSERQDEFVREEVSRSKPHRKRNRSSRETERVSDVAEILIDEGYDKDVVDQVTRALLTSRFEIPTDVNNLVNSLRHRLKELEANRDICSSELATTQVVENESHSSRGSKSDDVQKTESSGARRYREQKLDNDIVLSSEELWVEVASTVTCDLVCAGIRFDDATSAIERIARNEGLLSGTKLCAKLMREFGPISWSADVLTGAPTSPTNANTLYKAVEKENDQSVNAQSRFDKMAVLKQVPCQSVELLSESCRTKKRKREIRCKTDKQTICDSPRSHVTNNDGSNAAMEVIDVDKPEETGWKCVDVNESEFGIAPIYCIREAQESFCEGQSFANLVEIILVIDTREFFGSGLARERYVKEMEEGLKGASLKTETRCLPAGDALYLARFLRGGKEIVLDYIIERKTVYDYVDSWIDGRMKHQVHAMECSQVAGKMILLEGDMSEMESYGRSRKLSAEKLQSHLEELSVRDGFFVNRTRNMGETVAALACMQRELRSIFSAMSADDIVKGRKTYPEWVELINGQTRRMTLEQLFALQLCSVPGIGRGSAEYVIEQGFRTPAQLFDAYRRNNGRPGEGATDIFQNIGCSNRVGLKHPQRTTLYNLFNLEG